LATPTAKLANNMKDIESKHGEILYQLGKLSGKMDGIAQRLDIINGSVSRNTQRIEMLESWRSNFAGKLTIVVAVFGFFISLIVYLVNWYFS
jgi:archaellum component FlaC